MTITEYTQMKAFARQDGFFLGLMWCATFACFAYSTDYPELSLLYIAGVVATPVLLFMRLRNYRHNAADTGCVSFLRSYAYLLVTTCCAALVLTIGVYAYFRFVDNGRFMTIMIQSVGNAEVRKSLAEAGMDIGTLDSQLSAMAQMRPVDVAFSVFSNTLIMSAMMNAVIALIGKGRSSK